MGAPSALQAGIPEIWPRQVKVLPLPTLAQENVRIDAQAAKLPPELKPAVQFQKAFLAILAGASQAVWLGDLRRLAVADTGNNLLVHGVAEAARAWLARVQMQQIDALLHKYYRQHVAFPEQLAAIEAELPEAVRKDPWGEPWAYRAHAPEALGVRFAKFTTQRYQLGPARQPTLGAFKEAVGDRNPPQPKWKISRLGIGTRNALEFRTETSVATLEPGGKVDGFTLLHIGEDWALMAEADQLFTVTF